jgi:hypothetical protein
MSSAMNHKKRAYTTLFRSRTVGALGNIRKTALLRDTPDHPGYKGRFAARLKEFRLKILASRERARAEREAENGEG